MPHSFNRVAFALASTSGNSLLALYGSLVTIELALKDLAPTWRNGHRVAQWLIDQADPGLTSLTQQLSTAFGAMSATDRTGTTCRLGLDSYPEVRYLRHETDFPGESSDAQLTTCLLLVRDIEAVLRMRGIL